MFMKDKKSPSCVQATKGRLDSQHNDILLNDTQHNDARHNELNCDTRHNGTDNSRAHHWVAFMLSAFHAKCHVVLSDIMLNVIMGNVVTPKCRGAAECTATWNFQLNCDAIVNFRQLDVSMCGFTDTVMNKWNDTDTIG